MDLTDSKKSVQDGIYAAMHALAHAKVAAGTHAARRPSELLHQMGGFACCLLGHLNMKQLACALARFACAWHTYSGNGQAMLNVEMVPLLASFVLCSVAVHAHQDCHGGAHRVSCGIQPRHDPLEHQHGPVAVENRALGAVQEPHHEVRHGQCQQAAQAADRAGTAATAAAGAGRGHARHAELVCRSCNRTEEDAEAGLHQALLSAPCLLRACRLYGYGTYIKVLYVLVVTVALLYVGAVGGCWRVMPPWRMAAVRTLSRQMPLPIMAPETCIHLGFCASPCSPDPGAAEAGAGTLGQALQRGASGKSGTGPW